MINRIICLIIFVISITTGVAQNNKTFAEDFIINANVYSLGGEFKNEQYHFVIYNKVDTSQNVKLPPLNSLDARVFTLCFTGSFKSKFHTNMRAHDSLEVFLHATGLHQKAAAFFNAGSNQDPHAGLFILKDTIPVFLNDLHMGVPFKLKFYRRKERTCKLRDTVITTNSKCTCARVKKFIDKGQKKHKKEIKTLTDRTDSLNRIKKDRPDITVKNAEIKKNEDSLKIVRADSAELQSRLSVLEAKANKTEPESTEIQQKKNELSDINKTITVLKLQQSTLERGKKNAVDYAGIDQKIEEIKKDIAKREKTGSSGKNLRRSLAEFKPQHKIIRKDSCLCNFYDKDTLYKYNGKLFFNLEQHRNCLKKEIVEILAGSALTGPCRKALNDYDVYNGFIQSEPKVSIKLDEKELYVLTKSRLDDLKDHVEYLKKNKICEELDDAAAKKTKIDSSMKTITEQLEGLNASAGKTIKGINKVLREIESELDTNCVKKSQIDLIKKDFEKIKIATKSLNIDSVFFNNGYTIQNLKKLVNGLKNAIDTTQQLQSAIKAKNDSTVISLNRKKTSDQAKKNPCDSTINKIQNFTNALVKLNQQLDTIGEKLDTAIFIKTKLETQGKAIDKLISTHVNGAQKYLHYFYTDTCQVEFAAGTIKNITVFGTYDGKRYTLVNRYPVSISSRSEPEDFKRVKLYEPNTFKFWAFLNNIVHYIPVLTPNSEDYTPEESVQNFKAGETAHVLNKEKATEILKGRVFTDFMGIDPRNPNGLIQTEVSKKVNLYTRVFEPLKKRHRIGSLNKYNIYFSVGSYYEPKILVSKIEANNRNLPAQYSDSLVYDGNNNVLISEPRKFVSTLQLIRYSFFSIKPVNFNLGSVSFPKAKTSLYLDFGASWYLTSVSDSISSTSGGTTVVERRNDVVNSLSYNFDFIACIKPDTRYGFMLTASYIHYKLFDRRYYQAGNPDFYGKYLEKRDIYPSMFNFRLDAFYRPFKRVDGEIFFRFNSFVLLKDMRQNFMQAQLGTAIRFLR